MAGRSCLNCIYMCCDPDAWLRNLAAGEPLVPRCANHPRWPGELHEVPGTPCRNYRPKPATPAGEIRRIPVDNGLYAYVDAADYEWLSAYKWSCNNSGYAARREKGKVILMHREIMRPPKGMVVDHIDSNRLNDCRSNLRICTPEENKQNYAKRFGCSSRFKGVYYFKKTGKWCARLTCYGKDFWLGCFDDEVEAARAYDRKAVELGIEFARLNFPNEWPPERRQEVHAQWLKANAGKAGNQSKPKSKRGSPRVKPARRSRQQVSCKATRTTRQLPKRPDRKKTKAKSKAKRR